MTEVAKGINWREVAYVQHDPSNPHVEHFTYFIEKAAPVRQWFFMGMNKKTQTVEVYNKPEAYPLYQSDPSFTIYPEAKLFHIPSIPE